MSLSLIFLALVASYQTGPMAWGLGTLLAWARASARTRHAVWAVAFWAGPLTTAAILATAWLPLHGLKGVLRPTPAQLAQAGAVPQPHEIAMVDVVTAACLATVAAGIVFRLGWLGLKFARLAAVRRRSRPSDMRFGGLPVRLSDELTTPLLAGVRRPTILLPARFGAPEAAEAAALISRHEAAHAARHDNLRLLLEELLLALFWFNIVQSRLRARLAEAREEICDSVAVAGLSAAARQTYARNLLDCLQTRPSGLLAVGLINPPRRHAAMRIEAILTPRPQRRRLALAAGLTALITASSVGVFAWSAGLEAPVPATGGTAGASPAHKQGPLELQADQVAIDKSRHVTTWLGHATVSGITKDMMDGLFIDGRPATEADLRTLPQTQFASIKATFNPNGHELERLDAETNAGAGR